MRKLLFIPCLLMALTSYAQLIVQGVVLNDQNEPLSGVSINYGGAKTAATTDAEGNFAIETVEGSNVVFTLAGYRTAKLPAQEVMLVILKSKNGGSSSAATAPVVTYQPATTTKTNNSQASAYQSAPKSKKSTSSYSNNDWRFFITPNVGYSLQQSAMKGISGYGLTLGMFKTGGWYASVMVGPQFPKETMPSAKSASDFLYTGKTQVSRCSGTLGFLVGRVVYFYAGAGYGRRTVFCEAYDDYAQPRYWVPEKSKTSIRNGMMCEAGLLANIKGFVLSAGANCLTDFNNTLYWELKFGIGGAFRVH